MKDFPTPATADAVSPPPTTFATLDRSAGTGSLATLLAVLRGGEVDDAVEVADPYRTFGVSPRPE